ncbi:CHAT domain-containing protein [Nocardia sp. XZ_19_385]|uniref:CHAT domain-containing protein n=1 Tax=Nocardia sp. XZ_19_385 TaxID=2769488 RepID=UPI00188E370A|nr:CHAT domain-containing protein [Nocardia sp. XZ_19_385]
MTRSSEQPTVLIRMADAGDLYMSWRWVGNVAPGGVSMLPGPAIDEVVDRLVGELPIPGAPDGLERALTTGAFATPDAEYLLARDLSRALVPSGLASQLAQMHGQGIRPLIRLQPSPRLAQVPWEILAPAPDLRLLDLADLSLLAPASIVGAPGRTVRRWAEQQQLPVVAILDPRIPGFRADSALGSVLGRMDTPSPLTERIADYVAQQRFTPEVPSPFDAFRRTHVDRDWLSTALRKGASRLLYVGHVTAAAPESGQSENAELHLACGAETTGFAAANRTHRPLSAKDFLLGTHTISSEPTAGSELWPIPSRVALIACESGGDLRFTEALGLTAAMIAGGAELVTATRWPLPTDLAFQRFAGTDVRPLLDTICAVDAAHEQPDPVVALIDWQRDRLKSWRNGGAIAHSPILWSALATIST